MQGIANALPRSFRARQQVTGSAEREHGKAMVATAVSWVAKTSDMGYAVRSGHVVVRRAFARVADAAEDGDGLSAVVQGHVR